MKNCLLAVMWTICSTSVGCSLVASEESEDRRFEELGRRYLDTYPALSPVSATTLGDHRFDGKLDDISEEARSRWGEFCRKMLEQLRAIDRERLSRGNRVDSILLENRLRSSLWRLEVLKEWSWNPLRYTSLAGGAIYGLLAREFAPLPERLSCVADRLEQFPRLFRQIRETLDPPRVPKIHADTAVKQNRGVLSILVNRVTPHLGVLTEAERMRLENAMKVARQAVESHQKWLETELLPRAKGDFRLGAELFDVKLRHTLQTGMTREQIRERADAELQKARDMMYRISQEVYKKKHPYTVFPEKPSKAYRQAIIRACLEMAYEDLPEPDRIVETARESLELTTRLVRERDLVTIPSDPLEIIVMPEYQRGVSLAYCDSPGPLDVGQKTFYAVAPPPEDWTEEQVLSFLREYNLRSLHELTIHEAMPGHYLQLAHSNRYPSRLRAVLSSGVFIEGWAVYAEELMVSEGFLDADPLMNLIRLKWYLRGIANAIMDQAIHTEGMTREEALRMMIEDTFQEEREAAAKWVRAQLTATQLSTYFVGYLEHTDLRAEAEQRQGDKFSLKQYHETLLSFGSPPTRFVRALMFDLPIPRS